MVTEFWGAVSIDVEGHVLEEFSWHERMELGVEVLIN
jgi:hypothetical protein